MGSKESDTTEHLSTNLVKRKPYLEHGLQSKYGSSVQFSRLVVSDSLRPHESQHARPPCPSPAPGVHSDSCPSSPWCHPAISSSVVPFASCPQSLPAFNYYDFFEPSGRCVWLPEPLPFSTVLLQTTLCTQVTSLAWGHFFCFPWSKFFFVSL